MHMMKIIFLALLLPLTLHAQTASTVSCVKGFAMDDAWGREITITPAVRMIGYNSNGTASYEVHGGSELYGGIRADRFFMYCRGKCLVQIMANVVDVDINRALPKAISLYGMYVRSEERPGVGRIYTWVDHNTQMDAIMYLNGSVAISYSPIRGLK